MTTQAAAPLAEAYGNVVPIQFARERRMRVVRDERTALLELRSNLDTASARLTRAQHRVAERIEQVERRLDVLGAP